MILLPKLFFYLSLRIMSENEFLNYFQELKLFENLMAPHLFRYGLLLF